MSKIELEDIEIAYRKLKSYFYYDTFSAITRESIAKFEAEGNVDEKFESIRKFLNSKNPKTNKTFLNYLSKISVLTIPKTYKSSKEEKDDEFILTNKTPNLPFKLDRVNFLISAPIELHIVSVLWIIREGHYLQKSYDRYNYAYKISLSDQKNNVVPGLRLFEKYFNQYQKWRDKSIDTAKSLLSNGQDATIIQMDIKEYFHNVPLDFNNVRNAIKEESDIKCELTNLLELIYEQYSIELNKLKDSTNNYKDKFPLPIGMLSSGVLGNWFLKDFDTKIVSQLAPAFYGRYVDDITIVLSNTPIQRNENIESPFQNFLNEYFVKRGLLEQETENKEIVYYLNLSTPNLSKQPLLIQKRKLSILEFSHKESLAALNNFIIKLKENSSIFWMLPEDEKDSVDFEKSANDLIYNDTVNKLRSLNEIVPSKFGASVFLAKRILSSLLSDESASLKTDEQLLTFFQGKYTLEFYQLWEKVCTYFVINNKKNEFWKFYYSCCNSIINIESTNSSIHVTSVKQYLLSHLASAISLAISLKPQFLLNEKSSLYKKFSKLKNGVDVTKIAGLAIAYRKSNMIRHNYVTVPLLNYCHYSLEYNSPYFKSLLIDDEIKLLQNITRKQLKIDYKSFRFSPRYIHLFEANLHSFYRFIVSSNKEYLKKGVFDFNQSLAIEVVDTSFKVFYKLNYKYRNDLDSDFKEYYKNKLYTINKENKEILKIDISTNDKLDKVSVAVGNHKILKEEIMPSIKNKLVFTNEKKQNLIRILNQAEEEKADILILPEITVPFKWLKRIADESRRKNRAIIGGIEHFSINRVCYNYMATVLPIRINGLKESLIIPRLKNHYSPEESEVIKNIRYKVPKARSHYYHLYKWRNISFTAFNCYELADVNHRSLFKSKVDIIFASEYNSDWKYFSNVAESTSRDIHCYYVQSNTSNIGDSRIIQPTKSESKDILRLKGGQKSSVLVGILDIRKLREFQELEYSGQKDNKSFKSTPPDFDKEGVKKR